jgi:hypothetical protein
MTTWVERKTKLQRTETHSSNARPLISSIQQARGIYTIYSGDIRSNQRSHPCSAVTLFVGVLGLAGKMTSTDTSSGPSNDNVWVVDLFDEARLNVLVGDELVISVS